MNWIDAVWVGMSAASLTLGLIHLLVWWKRKALTANLLFFVVAISGTLFGAFELAMMHAPTPAAYAAALRWAHVPLALLTISIAGFVHLYFDAGRRWLFYALCAVRLLILALNFTTGVNINMREVLALERLSLWGGATVSSPIVIANPWTLVAFIGNLLLLGFVVDACATLWRRGSAEARRRAAVVGGSLVVCIIGASAFGMLIVVGVLRGPTIVMPGIFLVVLAMGYELGQDLVAAAQLTVRLQASELRFGAVVEAVPTAILLVDDEGNITFANAHAQAMFGYSRAELLAMPVEALMPRRFRDRHVELRGAFASAPQTRPMGAGRELYGCRKDGSEFPLEAALGAMAMDRKSFALVSVLDISERRDGERTMTRQRDELAHLSRVAMLGELSGSLAHELNQPLTAILSNAQAAQRFLAQSPPRVDKLAEILSDIVKSDHRAGAVIQRLRSLLRKEDSQRAPIDVNELIVESLHLLRSDLLSRHVAVDTDLVEALPPVNGDRNQLQQVLLNFIINGCEAMDGLETQRRLLVRTRRAAQGGVEIGVADCGAGIAEGQLEHIFAPFVTTKSSGLGLGLAICRSIVESHGGRLWASNNAGRGATLHVELPALRD